MAKLNHPAKPEDNVGHGWVHKRADGKKERCGGPDGGCKVCKEELAAASQPFCPSATVDPTDKDTLLGCSQPGRKIGNDLVTNHHGPHNYSRLIGKVSELGARNLSATGAKLDLKALAEAGVPVAGCGWCGFKGIHTSNFAKEHADCEAKKLGIHNVVFDDKAIGVGYLVLKTGDGLYSIGHYDPTREQKVKLLKRDEDWDSIQIHLTQFCGEDMPISTVAR